MAWASKNMLVLGVIVLLGMGLHLYNFWAKMQLVEIMGEHTNSLGLAVTDGAALIAYTFSQWYYVVLYLVCVRRPVVPPHARRVVDVPDRGLGQRHVVSPPRLKCIANIVATIVFLGFAAVVLCYFFCPCLAGAC